MKSSNKKIVFIDGHALLHRAYHAYPLTLTTTKGELVNAVYGFAANLFSIVKALQPEYVAVAFDLKGPTFRHEKFALYKASRVKPDEELINQIDRVKQVVRALNIPIFEVAGFEADDVIGTLAKQALLKLLPAGRQGKTQKSAGASAEHPDRKHREKRKATAQKSKLEKLEVIIATGDRDALQLVNEQTKVFFPGRGKLPARLVDEAEFEKEYGFEPELLVDFKALAGDASDDIPGVRGIGPKKATQLIQRFGTIEALYQALETGEGVGASTNDTQRLREGKDKAFLSKDLATIVTQVPIKLKLKACKLTDYNEETVEQLFEELEFRSLLSRLPGRETSQLRSKKNQPEADHPLDEEVRETEKATDRQMELF